MPSSWELEQRRPAGQRRQTRLSFSTSVSPLLTPGYVPARTCFLWGVFMGFLPTCFPLLPEAPHSSRGDHLDSSPPHIGTGASCLRAFALTLPAWARDLSRVTRARSALALTAAISLGSRSNVSPGREEFGSRCQL